MLLHIQIPDSDNVPSTRSSRVYRARHWLGVAKLDFISNNQYNFYSPPPVVSVPVTTESYKQTPGSWLTAWYHHPPSTILNNSSKLFTLFFFGVFRRQSLNINWLCNQKINVLVNKAQKTHLLQEKRKMLIFKITYFWLECVYVRLSVCHVPLGIIQLTPHSIGAHSPCLQRSGVSPFHFTQ